MTEAERDPRQVLDAAESLYAQGLLDQARQNYQELVEADRFIGYSHFALGRIARDQGDAAAAEAHFSAAIQSEPDFFWAHFELVRLRFASGQPDDHLVSAVQGLVRQPVVPDLAQAFVQQLETIAHHLWNDDAPNASIQLLEWLWPGDAFHQYSLIRLVQASRKPDVRRQAVDRLRAMPDIVAQALPVLFDYDRDMGSLDRLVPVLERHAQIDPGDFRVLTLLAQALYLTKQDSAFDALLLRLEQGRPQEAAHLRLLASIERNQLDVVEAIWRDHHTSPVVFTADIGISLFYIIRRSPRAAFRSELLDGLLALYPDNENVAAVQIYDLIYLCQLEEALRRFDSRFGAVEDHSEAVQVLHIDVLLANQNVQEAAAILDAALARTANPRNFVRPAFQIWAELGFWSRIFDTGLASTAIVLETEDLLFYLVKAARNLDRTELLLDHLLAVPHPHSEELSNIIGALIEDLAGSPRSVEIFRAQFDDLPLPRRRRVAIKLGLPDVVQATDSADKILYCVNADYLDPALVSLTSLAMNNPDVACNASIVFVLDADVTPAMRDRISRLAARLRINLDCVEATSLIRNDVTLRTAYGMISFGKSLHQSSYYRIFYAHDLALRQKRGRLLYIDADTIVQTGLSDLFSMPMTKPLSARPDRNVPETRRAVQLHRLTGSYFNSGVLLFDLSSPGIETLLANAMRDALDPAVTLLYHDQCAMNRAFDGRHDPLPPRYNHFLSKWLPDEIVKTVDATVVHLIDTPKPWDSLYTEDATLWFRWLDLVNILAAPPGDVRDDTAGR